MVKPADTTIDTSFEEIWEGFVEQCLPWANDNDDTREQAAELRKAFFAGAWGLIGWMAVATEDERFTKRFASIRDEIDQSITRAAS